jgi:hypothetical protein
MNEKANVVPFSRHRSSLDLDRQASRNPRRANARLLRSHVLRSSSSTTGRLGFGRWVCMSFVDDTETEHCWPNEPPILGWCNDYFPELLARRVPNWSQGEGSCGMFTWVLAGNRIAHSHFPGFCFPEPVHFEE